MRWPWYDWTEPTKTWVDMGNPCDDADLDLFYAYTTITIGNGVKTPFRDAPWVHDWKPKEIAPLIYEASTRNIGRIRMRFTTMHGSPRLKSPSTSL